MGAAILLVPAADGAPGLGVGHDALALAGLLALARLAVCAAAWDTSNGFALQGASRDLTLSVFVEAALVLSLAVAALVAGHDRPARRRRRDGGWPSVDDPCARARGRGVRARRHRRDG